MDEPYVGKAKGGRPRHNLTLVGGCVLVGLTLCLSACSSSSSNDGAVKGSSSIAASTGGSSATKGSSGCVSTAMAKVDAARAPFKEDLPKPFDVSTFKGKTFAYIGLSDAIKNIAVIGQNMQQGLASVGAKTMLFDGQGEPDVIAQAFNTAIGQKVAGIVTYGFDPAIVSSALAKAKAAGIPVVDTANGSPDGPLQPGVVAHVTIDAQQEGKVMADWVAMDSACKANTAFFYISSSAITVEIANAYQAELKALCPSTCNVVKSSIDVPTQATTTPVLATNVIQRDQVKYILATSDDETPLISQGISAAGSSGQVKVVAAVGDTLAAAQAGNDQAVDVMWPPSGYVGYTLADSIMRAAAGKPANVTLQIRVLDKTNWGHGTTLSDQAPGLVGYQQAFQKLWQG
jgi:ribose transport system substrate-binding protein